MTKDRVNWNEFQRLVGSELEKAKLSLGDLNGAFAMVRQIIRGNLEIYVDAPFMSHFSISIRATGRVIHATMNRGLDSICDWEVSCQP